MKRATITILAFLYLGLTSGIVKNLHYCMGQLSNVEFGYDEHDSCTKCGMTEKDGCCHSELKVVKLDDSHQWMKDGSIIKKSFAPTSVENRLSEVVLPGFHVLTSLEYHSPPDQRTNSVYLHTGVLLI